MAYQEVSRAGGRKIGGSLAREIAHAYEKRTSAQVPV
jgi:hypothetical protein